MATNYDIAFLRVAMRNVDSLEKSSAMLRCTMFLLLTGSDADLDANDTPWPVGSTNGFPLHSDRVS